MNPQLGQSDLIRSPSPQLGHSDLINVNPILWRFGDVPYFAGSIGCTMLVLWAHNFKLGHIDLIS